MDFQWSAGGCAQEMPTLFFLALQIPFSSPPVLSILTFSSRPQPVPVLTPRALSSALSRLSRETASKSTALQGMGKGLLVSELSRSL